MNLSITSKIKSIFGLNPKLVSSYDINSMSRDFLQSECKCEQATFEFMHNTHPTNEDMVVPSICDTIDTVEKEMVRPYSLKPELPVTQNSNGQLNILFETYTPSIQELVSLVEKENLGNNLGQPFVDICEYETIEDNSSDCAPNKANGYAINYFVKSNNKLIMKSLKITKGKHL